MEKGKETAKIADRQGISPENAPTRKRATVKEKVSKESVVTAARRVIPQGSAPKAKETVTKERVKERGAGGKAFGK